MLETDKLSVFVQHAAAYYPGKCMAHTSSTYTFTTCRILHPTDEQTRVTPRWAKCCLWCCLKIYGQLSVTCPLEFLKVFSLICQNSFIISFCEALPFCWKQLYSDVCLDTNVPVKQCVDTRTVMCLLPRDAHFLPAWMVHAFKKQLNLLFYCIIYIVITKQINMWT